MPVSASNYPFMRYGIGVFLLATNLFDLLWA
uniref:Uncharacterized protein n=1 Tax=Rhizophora mucronata TaxID=61149 RepID=A0A2P2Q270_RHIMU